MLYVSLCYKRPCYKDIPQYEVTIVQIVGDNQAYYDWNAVYKGYVWSNYTGATICRIGLPNEIIVITRKVLIELDRLISTVFRTLHSALPLLISQEYCHAVHLHLDCNECVGGVLRGSNLDCWHCLRYHVAHRHHVSNRPLEVLAINEQQFYEWDPLWYKKGRHWL